MGCTTSSTTENIVVKNDFSESIQWLPFVHYSKFATNDEKYRKHLQITHKSILTHNTGFYEFFVDEETHSIQYRSYRKHYGTHRANLAYIGLSSPYDEYSHSYFVRNNRYIIVFKTEPNDNVEHYVYCVYDTKNDSWYIDHDNTVMQDISCYSRSLLINDEILIISSHKELYFYFIGNDNILHPMEIFVYKLKTKNVSYRNHGFCIIDFKK